MEHDATLAKVFLNKLEKAPAPKPGYQDILGWGAYHLKACCPRPYSTKSSGHTTTCLYEVIQPILLQKVH